ncbi:MAG: YdeI/OmpD-associated family protein, partial [Allosphingosinicella sp.]
VYAYETALKELTAEEATRFRRDEAAWADWQRRPPGYRRVVLHWIASAKKPETRERRLATLIADSAAGRKIAGVDISRKKPD